MRDDSDRHAQARPPPAGLHAQQQMQQTGNRAFAFPYHPTYKNRAHYTDRNAQCPVFTSNSASSRARHAPPSRTEDRNQKAGMAASAGLAHRSNATISTGLHRQANGRSQQQWQRVSYPCSTPPATGPSADFCMQPKQKQSNAITLNVLEHQLLEAADQSVHPTSGASMQGSPTVAAGTTTSTEATTHEPNQSHATATERYPATPTVPAGQCSAQHSGAPNGMQRRQTPAYERRMMPANAGIVLPAAANGLGQSSQHWRAPQQRTQQDATAAYRQQTFAGRAQQRYASADSAAVPAQAQQGIQQVERHMAALEQLLVQHGRDVADGPVTPAAAAAAAAAAGAAVSGTAARARGRDRQFNEPRRLQYGRYGMQGNAVLSHAAAAPDTPVVYGPPINPLWVAATPVAAAASAGSSVPAAPSDRQHASSGSSSGSSSSVSTAGGGDSTTAGAASQAGTQQQQQQGLCGEPQQSSPQQQQQQQQHSLSTFYPGRPLAAWMLYHRGGLLRALDEYVVKRDARQHLRELVMQQAVSVSLLQKLEQEVTIYLLNLMDQVEAVQQPVVAAVHSNAVQSDRIVPPAVPAIRVIRAAVQRSPADEAWGEDDDNDQDLQQQQQQDLTEQQDEAQQLLDLEEQEQQQIELHAAIDGLVELQELLGKALEPGSQQQQQQENHATRAEVTGQQPAAAEAATTVHAAANGQPLQQQPRAVAAGAAVETGWLSRQAATEQVVCAEAGNLNSSSSSSSTNRLDSRSSSGRLGGGSRFGGSSVSDSWRRRSDQNGASDLTNDAAATSSQSARPVPPPAAATMHHSSSSSSRNDRQNGDIRGNSRVPHTPQLMNSVSRPQSQSIPPPPPLRRPRRSSADDAAAAVSPIYYDVTRSSSSSSKAQHALQPPPPAPPAATAAAQIKPQACSHCLNDNCGDQLTCVVCLTHPRSVLILPCKHVALCDTCTFKLRDKAAKDSPVGPKASLSHPACPVCREAFTDIICGIHIP